MARTFVLINGAWHGGWAWHAVATELRAAGHEVHAPTLLGLGEGETNAADLRLQDCVDDAADYITSRGLTDVVLVGHSWGGFLVSGITKKLGKTIARRVYFNAHVPLSGESLNDIVPPEYVTLFDELAEASGNNTVIMPFELFRDALMQDAGEEAARIVWSALYPQPYRYFTDGLDLDGLEDLGVPASYVTSPDDIALPVGEYAWAPRFPNRLKDVKVVQTTGSHETLFTDPAAVAAALQEAAS